MEAWTDYNAALCAALAGLSVTGRDGENLDVAEGFRRWIELTREARQHGRTLYLIGNGGSATMASHFAADACKNGHLRALAFNDASMLTATANDLAFDQVFALPLTRLAHPSDLLVSISSSGNSPNILGGLDAARSIRMHIVTLSGKRADNRSRIAGDLNFYVPSDRYGWVECAHHLILHYWLDQYLNLCCDGAL